MTRRVVTGLNAEGKSAVIVDGPLVPLSATGGMVWRTDAVPADNAGSADITAEPFSFALMEGGGSTFMVVEYPVGMGEFWHATRTTDYIVILEGEVVLQLEAEEVRLKAGDVLVDRGVIHSWRNDGPGRAVSAVVTLPAHPLAPQPVEGAA